MTKKTKINGGMIILWKMTTLERTEDSITIQNRHSRQTFLQTIMPLETTAYIKEERMVK